MTLQIGVLLLFLFDIITVTKYELILTNAVSND